MSEHRKLRLTTAGRVVLTSLLTTFFAPYLVGVIVEVATTERLQTLASGPLQLAFTAPGLFPEALTVALYAWLICWIWTRSPDVLR